MGQVLSGKYTGSCFYKLTWSKFVMWHEKAVKDKIHISSEESHPSYLCPTTSMSSFLKCCGHPVWGRQSCMMLMKTTRLMETLWSNSASCLGFHGWENSWSFAVSKKHRPPICIYFHPIIEPYSFPWPLTSGMRHFSPLLLIRSQKLRKQDCFFAQ